MSAVEIKICGITCVADALAAIELGAAMVGVNFYAAPCSGLKRLPRRSQGERN